MEIKNIQNPWRNLLRTPASFRGVEFHVETGARSSGRRTVTHEYPKRDLPYAEDMGQLAQRFHFSGYLIYRPRNARYNYVQQRVRLVRALEQADGGLLVHPVFCQSGIMVMAERYTMTETRERGGFTAFEMQFVELGSAGNVGRTNTGASLQNQSKTTADQMAKQVNGQARAGAAS